MMSNDKLTLFLTVYCIRLLSFNIK